MQLGQLPAWITSVRGGEGSAGGRARVPLASTLEDLLRWSFLQRPPWQLVEVVVQDEFTHDVVVRDPTRGFLVFDTT